MWRLEWIREVRDSTPAGSLRDFLVALEQYFDLLDKIALHGYSRRMAAQAAARLGEAGQVAPAAHPDNNIEKGGELIGELGDAYRGLKERGLPILARPVCPGRPAPHCGLTVASFLADVAAANQDEDTFEQATAALPNDAPPYVFAIVAAIRHEDPNNQRTMDGALRLWIGHHSRPARRNDREAALTQLFAALFFTAMGEWRYNFAAPFDRLDKMLRFLISCVGLACEDAEIDLPYRCFTDSAPVVGLERRADAPPPQPFISLVARSACRDAFAPLLQLCCEAGAGGLEALCAALAHEAEIGRWEIWSDFKPEILGDLLPCLPDATLRELLSLQAKRRMKDKDGTSTVEGRIRGFGALLCALGTDGLKAEGFAGTLLDILEEDVGIMRNYYVAALLCALGSPDGGEIKAPPGYIDPLAGVDMDAGMDAEMAAPPADGMALEPRTADGRAGRLELWQRNRQLINKDWAATLSMSQAAVRAARGVACREARIWIAVQSLKHGG
jgi:hypothetical protein